MGLLKAILFFGLSYFLANFITLNVNNLEKMDYIGPYVKYFSNVPIERLMLIILFVLLVMF